MTFENKIFGHITNKENLENDPLYAKVINAKNKEEFSKALKTLTEEKGIEARKKVTEYLIKKRKR